MRIVISRASHTCTYMVSSLSSRLPACLPVSVSQCPAPVYIDCRTQAAVKYLHPLRMMHADVTPRALRNGPGVVTANKPQPFRPQLSRVRLTFLGLGRLFKIEVTGLDPSHALGVAGKLGQIGLRHHAADYRRRKLAACFR